MNGFEPHISLVDMIPLVGIGTHLAKEAKSTKKLGALDERLGLEQYAAYTTKQNIFLTYQVMSSIALMYSMIR